MTRCPSVQWSTGVFKQLRAAAWYSWRHQMEGENPLYWMGAAGRLEPAFISLMLSVKEVSYYYLNPCDLLVPANWIYAESIQCWFTDILPGLNKCKAHQHHMKNVICEKPFSSAEMVVSGSIPFLQTFSGNITFAYDINCRRKQACSSPSNPRGLLCDGFLRG